MEVHGGGMALTTFSKNPYDDFRRSMEEMMDGRHVEPLQPLDWRGSSSWRHFQSFYFFF
ncbi:hypothetical protein KSP40_PGU002179 [Platanthera guangdongensis]|uniref:OVATE domain-containing protein n=1 Tax=Platanthera guangdongensis TaxID=2320717 RepID=A0ABR2LZA6_9ASPA